MPNNRKLTTAMFSAYPDLMTPQHLQEALGIGRTTTYKLLGSGELRHITIGAKYMIPKAYLIEFLNNSTCSYSNNPV